MNTPDTHTRTQTKTGSSKPKSKFVHVYNATLGIIACHVNRSKSDTVGPASRRIKFMPGNNRMLRSELELCEATPGFVHYTKALSAKTVSGHPYELTRLQVGKVVDHSKEEAVIDAKIKAEREQNA